MKKTMLIVSVLACALGLPRASAQVATQGRFPVSFHLLSASCTKAPADISGSGQGHFVAQTFVRNGNATMTMTFNRQGTASDALGNQYTFNDADHTVELSGPASGYETTITENFHLIGRGGAPNISMKALMHIKVLANGQVTVSVEKDSGDEGCEA